MMHFWDCQANKDKTNNSNIYYLNIFVSSQVPRVLQSEGRTGTSTGSHGLVVPLLHAILTDLQRQQAGGEEQLSLKVKAWISKTEAVAAARDPEYYPGSGMQYSSKLFITDKN
eukprot:2132650-Rhodomonas_salina.1